MSRRVTALHPLPDAVYRRFRQGVQSVTPLHDARYCSGLQRCRPDWVSVILEPFTVLLSLHSS